MKGYKIERYTDSHSDVWDDFVEKSKKWTFNAHVMIAYHGDRFTDASYWFTRTKSSLPFFKQQQRTYNLFPSRFELWRLVLSKHIKLSDALAAFVELLKYYAQKGFLNLIVKQTLALYHLQPSGEVQYALFVTQTKLYRRDAAICLRPSSFKPNENRKRKIKSANSHDFQIRETDNMEPFWNEVLIPNLQISHGGTPVHSLQEIQFLVKIHFQVISSNTIFMKEIKSRRNNLYSIPKKHLGSVYLCNLWEIYRCTICTICSHYSKTKLS